MVLDNLLSSDAYTPVNKSIAKELWFLTAWYFWELIRQRKRFWQEEFFFSQKDMFEEIWISEYQQRECMNTLIQNEMISIVKKWVPARYWFKIDDASVLKKLQHWCLRNCSTSAKKTEALLIRMNNKNDNNISSSNEEDNNVHCSIKDIEDKESNNSPCSIILKEERKKKEEISLDIEKMFEWFWNTYPRKVWKVLAKKSFIKVMKKDLDIYLLAYAVKKLCKHISDNNIEQKFIKHPSVYLNQEVFRDFENEFLDSIQEQNTIESPKEELKDDDIIIKKRNYNN